jgi:hypothetical protein
MKKDKICLAVEKALNGTKEEHHLNADEIEKLAFMVTTVAKSTPDIRIIFYTEMAMVAKNIKDILDIKCKDEQEKNKNKKDILN